MAPRTNVGWKFFTDYEAWNDKRRLFVRYLGRDGSRAFVEPFTLRNAAEGAAFDTPTLTEFTDDVVDGVGDVENFLQGAMDCAWALGMRPTGFADHTDELTAVRYHLEDMRKLAKVKA